MPLRKEEKQLPDIEVNPTCLEGLAFAFSGDLVHFTRETVKQFVTERGGEFKSGISKKATYCVLGKNSTDKKQQECEEKGVPMIEEDKFIEMVREKTENTSSAQDEVEDVEEADVEEEETDEVEALEVSEYSKENKKRPTDDVVDSRKKRKEENFDEENVDIDNEESVLDVQGAAVAAGSE